MFITLLLSFYRRQNSQRGYILIQDGRTVAGPVTEFRPSNSLAVNTVLGFVLKLHKTIAYSR